MSAFAELSAYVIGTGAAIYFVYKAAQFIFPCSIRADEYDEPLGDASTLDRRVEDAARIFALATPLVSVWALLSTAILMVWS